MKLTYEFDGCCLWNESNETSMTKKYPQFSTLNQSAAMNLSISFKR